MSTCTGRCAELSAELSGLLSRVVELERARQAWCEEATAHVQTIADLKRALGEERAAHAAAYSELQGRFQQLERELDRLVPEPPHCLAGEHYD